MYHQIAKNLITTALRHAGPLMITDREAMDELKEARKEAWEQIKLMLIWGL